MAEELDVFAMSAKPAKTQNQSNANQNAAVPGKKQFHKNHQHPRREKQNNSPIRGANGSESVNPLLNAPLPQESRQIKVEAGAAGNRNLDLPEYRLADIQIWPAQQIVDTMMAGADPEELGTYRKHELIFAAIRTYNITHIFYDS